MKPLLAVVVVLSCALAGLARADISITENDKSVRIDCTKDGTLMLAGNHLTITATGVCASVTIAGNESSFTGSALAVSIPGNTNTVSLAAADEVSVTGNGNAVMVKKAIKRKAPRFSNLGNNNIIAP